MQSFYTLQLIVSTLATKPLVEKVYLRLNLDIFEGKHKKFELLPLSRLVF